MFRESLSKEQLQWEGGILWCRFKQLPIFLKTNFQVEPWFQFPSSFLPNSIYSLSRYFSNFVSLLGTNLPTSSYRLGVKAANLHELFPTHITEALKHSISMFDREVIISYSLISSYNTFIFSIRNTWTYSSLNLKFQLPGFISSNALLHGVEVIPFFSSSTFPTRLVWGDKNKWVKKVFSLFFFFWTATMYNTSWLKYILSF